MHNYRDYQQNADNVIYHELITLNNNKCLIKKMVLLLYPNNTNKFTYLFKNYLSNIILQYSSNSPLNFIKLLFLTS